MGHALSIITDREFAALDCSRVVLIPIGSIEPHGHLPLGVDTLLPARILERVAQRSERALLMPALPVGNNFKYGGWPGSVSLSFTTLKSLFGDLFSSFVRQGLTRFFVMSGHDENAEAAVAAGREATLADSRVRVVYCDWIDLGISIVKELSESRQEGHGSELQTSAFLHLFPELRCDLPPNAVHPADPAGEEFRDDLFFEGEVGTWIRPVSRGETRSAYGSVATARAEKGKRLVDHIVARAVRVVELMLAEEIP